MRRSMNTVFEESNEGALDSTGSSGNLLDRDNSSVRLTKRYRVFQEIMETEQNYVEALHCILTDYRNPLMELEADECDKILSDHERHVLFSRVEHIMQIHQNILDYLEHEDRDWSGKNLIGYKFAYDKELLIKYYVPYINSYDEILEILERIKADPVADQFIKSCDSKSSKKFSFKDLLIRPVQRLPSVVLLLKELQKATPKSNPDYKCIVLALEVIDGVLNKANENRRTNDNHQQTLEAINTIENFPTEFIQANRSLYCQADFQVIHSCTPIFKRHRGAIVTLFLFNDLVVLAKRRDRIQSVYRPGKSRLSINTSMSSLNSSVTDLPRTLSRSGSMSTLKRSLSFISNMTRPERKPFKFIEVLNFINFRQFMYIRQDGLFYLKMRDDMSDEMCALKIAAETTVEIAQNLMQTLCDQINATTKRDVSLMDLSGMFSAKPTPLALHQDEWDYVKKTRRLLGRDRENIKPVFRFGGHTLLRRN